MILSVHGLKSQEAVRMPTGVWPLKRSSTSRARSARSRSVSWSRLELYSWIQLCKPISWPASVTARTSSGWSMADTAGMKNVAGTLYRSSTFRMRGTPARAPYWP